MSPAELLRYSFLWSKVRLVVAAIALFLGGIPPLRFVLSDSVFTSLILTVAWVLSGLASLYLLYRWMKAGQTLFGHKDSWDTAAFWVMVVSGLNLGIAGIFRINIGMTISSNYLLFVLVGLIYLASAYRLYTRYHAHGKHLF